MTVPGWLLTGAVVLGAIAVFAPTVGTTLVAAAGAIALTMIAAKVDR